MNSLISTLILQGFYKETGALGGPGEVLGGPGVLATTGMIAIARNSFEFLSILKSH